MPKKKNKNSGSRERTTPLRDAEPTSGNENSDKKYCHRQIRSNWDRYESEIVEHESPDEKTTNDFADLVNTPSDCNYFQFKSEKNWENEASYSTLSCHKFFDLDLEVLSHGLACLPFYERVGIDKSILSEADIEKCDKKASEGLLKYKEIKEKFMEKLKLGYELLPESSKEITNAEAKKDTQVSNANVTDKTSQMDDVFQSVQSGKKLVDDKNDDDNKNVKQNVSEKESLEAWLDSVLDD